jgi:hypothetical protein
MKLPRLVSAIFQQTAGAGIRWSWADMIGLSSLHREIDCFYYAGQCAMAIYLGKLEEEMESVQLAKPIKARSPFSGELIKKFLALDRKETRVALLVTRNAKEFALLFGPWVLSVVDPFCPALPHPVPRPRAPEI